MLIGTFLQNFQLQMHLKTDLTKLGYSNEPTWLKTGYQKARRLLSYGYNITKDIWQQCNF
jgi:hypothetical protein